MNWKSGCYRLLFLLLTGSAFAATGQPHQQLPKKRAIRPNYMVTAYLQALTEYVKAVYKDGSPTPDTLFIGKNIEMPKMDLPETIRGVPVLLIPSEAAQKKLTYRKSLVYVNEMGWIDADKAEFLFVTFYEFKPQHHCVMHFKGRSKTEMLQLESLTFEYPYGKK